MRDHLATLMDDFRRFGREVAVVRYQGNRRRVTTYEELGRLAGRFAALLAQRGIGKTGPNALHNGDNITVKFLPAKDGSPLGFLKTVTMPDGRVIQISAGNAND